MMQPAAAELDIHLRFLASKPDSSAAQVTPDVVLGDYTSLEELRGVAHPVLLAHGYHDRIVPLRSSSLPLMDLLPNAELHAFGQSGHWVMIEQTRAFTSVVRAFLEAEG